MDKGGDYSSPSCPDRDVDGVEEGVFWIVVNESWWGNGLLIFFVRLFVVYCGKHFIFFFFFREGDGVVS